VNELFVELEFGRDRGRPIFVNPDHVASITDYRPYVDTDDTPQPAAVIQFRDTSDGGGWIVSGTAKDVAEKLTPVNLPVNHHTPR
jgi:hypothetical protein